MKNFPIRQPYLAIWTIAYVAFMLLGILIPNSLIVTLLKLSGILLCLIYTLLYSKDLFLKVAFSLTLLADIFLAISSASIAGVVSFCFVQFAHYVRFKQSSYRALFLFYIIILLIFIISTFWSIDAHYPLAVVYGGIIITNIFLAKKHDSMSFLGFLFFFSCDILVAVSFLASIGVLNPILHPFADYFAWAFYLPSQVLIACAPTMATDSKSALKNQKVAKA